MKRWRSGLAGLLLVGAMLVGAAGAARAHGPTVVLSEAGFKPVLLNLFEGTTVHFTNTIAGPEGVVVADEGGTFSSPPITAASDGWHYTFEKIGTFEIRIAGRPEAKLRIVVVKKPGS